jgi:phosphoribosyl-AMP cyclohydrolase
VVDEDFVRRWVERLRAEVPDAVAVLVGGSQVRGDAGPHSDVDFDIVVPDGPRDEWPAWFADGVRVSTWIRDLDTWQAARSQPQDWAFGLPCADPVRLCWAADDSWRQRFELTEVRYPAGEPELDHLEGEAGKVANARAAGDPLGLRLAAQDLARSVVSILVPLNAGPPVCGRGEALRALLDFTVVPDGYREDMLTCMGLADRYAGADEVHAAAGRLVRGVVALLEEHATVFARVLAPSDARRLSDGSMRRYLDSVLAEG